MTRWVLALFAFSLVGCARRGTQSSICVAAGDAWEPPRLSADRRAKFEKLAPALDAMLAEEQRKSGAPGIAVGIVLGGETVYAKGFGLRDIERDAPFTPDTPFPIASVTKSFTAMAILKLRDEGKLDLDVPAARYYPPLAKLSYPTSDAPQITLRHLLTHSSGMPEDNPWADVTENLTDAELATLLDGGVMSRVPGVQFEYSNIGYGVLGRVVERVSGLSTREYLRRAILTPLAMRDTGFAPEDFAPGNVAVGYRGREGSHDLDAPRVVAPAERLGVMEAAGGIYTTIRSLTRYVGYHLTAWRPRDDPESGPVKRSTLREMQQGVRKTNWSEFVPRLVQRFPPTTARIGPDGVALLSFAYGLGLSTFTTCEREVVVDHSGGLPGYISFLTMLPEVGAGIVVFVNDERVRSKATESVIKMLRTSGLFEWAQVEPHPALADARLRLLELLEMWDDAKARAVFEPTFFRYQTIGALQEEFARMTRAHGTCRFDKAPTFVNRLRGTWRMVCDRGAIQWAAGLAPGRAPRLQALQWREDLPPSPELERAGGAMTKLLDHWDAASANERLAKSEEVPKLEGAFAALSVAHGACKMDRVVESDGKTRAVFLLSCERRPLELTVMLDPSGKIAQAQGRPPRSDARPNCAD